ncbi:MAG: NAD(+) diphosphatase [Pseudomonadota bacterium]
MKPSHNVFAGAYIDRATEFRTDPRWQASALRQAHTRFLVVRGGECAAWTDERRLVLLPTEDLDTDGAPTLFLGLNDGAPVFAVAVDEDHTALPSDAEFVDLRTLGGWLPPAEANLAAHAVGLTRWRHTQRFCPRCGTATELEAAGYASRCTNPACGHRTFPRVDPAIIVLVDRGDECLLGRQPNWPEGMYLTIAGFVEPGESLEDAVAREVFEETNVQVDRVLYHSSQPWPFPSSLMLGFRARATSDDIRRNDGELEDVRWFKRADITERRCRIPPRQSIARQLIDSWVRESD